MKISIAMATYNGGKYLQQQLDSLLAQTLLPHELVICDDGSTDDTLVIVEKFATTAPFAVRIYRNEQNLGYADNFLTAASLCEGDWIAFCDQDDVWDDDKLRIAANYIDESVLLVVHSAEVTDEQLNPLHIKIPDFKILRKGGIDENNPIKISQGFTFLFDSKLINDFSWKDRPNSLRGPRGKVSHDWWIYWLANVFGSIVFLPYSLAKYRRHELTVGGKINSGRFSRFIRCTHVGRDEYNEASYIADNFSKYLSKTKTTKYFDDAKRMYGASYYQRISELYQLRSEVYGQCRLISRIAPFIRILFGGGYLSFSNKYSLGIRSMAKDTYTLIALMLRNDRSPEEAGK